MDLVHLGLAPTLHLHASGALTFCAGGDEPPMWEDEPVFVTVA